MTQRKSLEELNLLTEKVIGAAVQVHRELGPGLLENVYSECLAVELADCGLQALREMTIPLRYKTVSVSNAYRLDFLVNDSLILECKAIDQLLPIHSAQVLTYL